MNLPSGFLLQKGKYKLMNVIGQGGFGITYRGIWYTEVKGSLGTIKTEVPVCIKEYFFKDYCFRDENTNEVKVYSETGKALFNKFKEKLTKEARILSEVHHPYIVNVLEVFEENNTAYIAMEYISGHSLKYILEQTRFLPEDLALKYIHQVGEALSFVHEKNILHLDIKPSNILIDQKDNARLIDFGVSKRYDIDQEETSTTLLTLSKGFASIEQYDSEGIQTFSPYPDIYSLGATLYNLLTGQIPTESILRATRPLKSPREINANISEKTEQVILKAMRIVPSERYSSIQEMMDSLDYPKIPVTGSISRKETLTSNSDAEEEEETTILKNTPTEEGEETIVNQPPQQMKENKEKDATPIKQKRVPKKAGIISVSAIAVGASLFLVWDHLNSDPGETSYVLNPQTEESPIVKDTMSTVASTSSVSRNDTSNHQANPEVENNNPVDQQDRTGEILEKNPSVPTEKREMKSEPSSAQPETTHDAKPAVKQANEAENKKRYNELIASAKRNMGQKRFNQARHDLESARDLNLTEEVVRLMISCDEQFKKEQIRQKREQYEEKMPFGGYMIVRKKSNGKYGAIDQNAEERIPCKYLSVGRAENGRAFEREDHLFDIYDANAKIINSGVTYY